MIQKRDPDVGFTNGAECSVQLLYRSVVVIGSMCHLPRRFRDIQSATILLRFNVFGSFFCGEGVGCGD